MNNENNDTNDDNNNNNNNNSINDSNDSNSKNKNKSEIKTKVIRLNRIIGQMIKIIRMARNKRAIQTE